MRKEIVVLLFCVNLVQVFAKTDPDISDRAFCCSPFLNNNITVLSEKVHLIINEDFTKGQYDIQYKLKVYTEGKQIPFLFLLKDHKGPFKVFVDNKEVLVKYATKDILSSQILNQIIDEDGYMPAIQWQGFISFPITDFRFFEIDLLKGYHDVKVSYLSDSWRKNNNKGGSFIYSLSPVKKWKNFNQLEFSVNFSKCKNKNITTNLGTPLVNEKNFKTWVFNRIPNELIEIKYESEDDFFEKYKTLIYIGVFIQLTLICLLVVRTLGNGNGSDLLVSLKYTDNQCIKKRKTQKAVKTEGYWSKGSI